jgi:PAS domain S-box-containing protein
MMRSLEEIYGQVFEHLPQKIYWKDKNLTYLACNEAFARFLGISVGEIVGKQDSFFFPQDVVAENQMDDKEVISSGEKRERETLLPIQGEERWVHLVKVPIHDKSGKISGICGILEEVTEQRRMREKVQFLSRIYSIKSHVNKAVVRIRERDTLLNEVCQIAIDHGQFRMAWVGIVDEQTKWVQPVCYAGFVDNYFSMMKPISVDDVPEGRGPTGKALREGTHFVCDDIATNPDVAFWCEEALKRGYRSSIAVPLALSGKIFGVFSLYSSIPHFFDQQEIDVLLDIANEISFGLHAIETGKELGDTEERYKQIFINERKQAEANLKRLNEQLEEKIRDRTMELEEANQELEAFSYSVSHDLRAPLRGLNGFARILLEDYSALLPEEGKHYLRMIPENANKMSILIDDLLALSRLSRQEMDIHMICMRDLAEKVFNEVVKVEDKVRIQFNLGDIPDTQGDLALMRQVWVNLLGNAVKFTAKKGKPFIEVGCYTENKSVVYFVKDNGAGFEMKYAEKMFGVFQRFHGASEFEGNGVGLAIVRRLLARMSGRIWANGEVNKGASFFFTVKEN